MSRNAVGETTTQDRPGSRGSAGRRTNGPLERITVNLTPRAAQALDRLVELTGDSKTDSINRALQAYALIEEAQQAGGSAYLRETPGSELERLRFF